MKILERLFIGKHLTHSLKALSVYLNVQSSVKSLHKIALLIIMKSTLREV